MAFMAFACNAQTSNSESMEANMNPYPSNKTKEEWKKELSPEQYYVLFEKGTERPGTGQYNLHFEEGTYNCGACGTPLFTSDMKFDSHCGWPSFDREIEGGTVVRTVDKTHGMIRTEITCANCGGHLGHVFNDGPTETGERYCVNSLSLDFEKKEEGSN
jgi:peptide-methionine (R)-S-oxide reductase